MLLRKWLFAPVAPLVLAAASLVSSEASAAPALRAEGGRFVDAAGRTIVLRGVDVAGNSKVPPFTAAADPAIFAKLPALGMNVVRLLFTWEAYEPTKGTYDEAYLDYYAAAAKAAGEQGLFVIVDIHQDGFSRASIGGCGDGFPLWALPSGQTPAVPDNGSACKSWGVKMQSDKDMLAAWSAFYGDAEGVRTSYLAMLESLSSRLAGEPSVIGYDLLNEPWGDEVTEIGPLYEDGAAAVRKASPDAIVFVSPHARTSAGSQTKLVKPSFGNLAYSPHFYDASVILFKKWSGLEPDTAFQLMNDTASAWGAPLFVGEFGAPATTEEVGPYMETLYRHLDDHLTSGAQWAYTPGWTEAKKDGWNDEDFSIVDGTGALRPNHVPRPHPIAIAGDPIEFRVTESEQVEARRITLSWQNDPGADQTRLFIPPAFFDGHQLVVTVSGDSLEYKRDGDGLKFLSPSAGKMSVDIAIAASGSQPDAAQGGCCTAPGAPPSRAALLGALAILGIFAARRRITG